MTAKILMVICAAILFFIGALHLVFTFFGTKLTPRDNTLLDSMRSISPVITRETTMWRAWIGFNATHSMCLMLFGLIYGFLAISYPSLLFASPYLLVVGFITAAGFFVLSRLFFFSKPLILTGISLTLYVASVVVALA